MRYTGKVRPRYEVGNIVDKKLKEDIVNGGGGLNLAI